MENPGRNLSQDQFFREGYIKKGNITPFKGYNAFSIFLQHVQELSFPTHGQGPFSGYPQWKGPEPESLSSGWIIIVSFLGPVVVM
jgi:hypothetical protein